MTGPRAQEAIAVLRIHDEADGVHAPLLDVVIVLEGLDGLHLVLQLAQAETRMRMRLSIWFLCSRRSPGRHPALIDVSARVVLEGGVEILHASASPTLQVGQQRSGQVLFHWMSRWDKSM